MTARITYRRNETGSVMLIVIVFIVVIGLLGLGSMQGTRLELRMATNEELRVNGYEIAQALADAVIATPAMTPVIGAAGFTVCTPGHTPCDVEGLFMPDPALAPEVTSGHLSGTAVLTAPAETNCFRGSGNSVSLACSQFELTTTYDRTADGLGRSSITQGLLIVTPNAN